MLDFSYIILGILQGIFEWVPISSEGITALTSQFLIKEISPIDMALFLHLGTFFAVLVYFRNDWKKLFLRENPKLFRFLTISTIISLAIGYVLYKVIINVAVGYSLLFVMGFGLLITAYFHKSKKNFNLNLDNGLGKLAIISGFLQGLAVIPGLSRSGSTIFGLSLGNFSPSQILKISYMMSAPVVLASSIYIILKTPILIEAWPCLISSFVAGIISLHFLMKISEKINFYWFALIFAIICFAGGIIGLCV